MNGIPPGLVHPANAEAKLKLKSVAIDTYKENVAYSLPPGDYGGHDIVVVDDIAGSGRTLEAAARLLVHYLHLHPASQFTQPVQQFVGGMHPPFLAQRHVGLCGWTLILNADRATALAEG